jgi:AAA+ ATPase superfamily predicted ATPase
MRDLVQASTLLGIIGNGANRISEIAARAEKNAATLSAPLKRLVTMQLVDREIPFGENPKNSKHGIYHLSDPFISFYYRFISPYRSLLELGRIDYVEEIVQQHFPEFEGFCWERLCRQAVSGQVVGGEMFNVASRWWGNVGKSERIEIDVVAESMDKKTLLVGECKWTNSENAGRLFAHLNEQVQKLPFVHKYKKIVPVLFLKERPRDKTDGIVFLPEDVLKII